MATIATTVAVNTAAISSAIAQATHYVVPSVNQVFAAGVPIDQVNQSMVYPTAPFDAGTYIPIDFHGLYYNVSFLWPEWNITGPIFQTEKFVSSFPKPFRFETLLTTSVHSCHLQSALGQLPLPA